MRLDLETLLGRWWDDGGTTKLDITLSDNKMLEGSLNYGVATCKMNIYLTDLFIVGEPVGPAFLLTLPQKLLLVMEEPFKLVGAVYHDRSKPTLVTLTKAN